mgnify:CR=1 FL=1
MGSVDVLCYSHKEENADQMVTLPANYLRTIINRRTGLYYKILFVLRSMFRMVAGRCCYEKDGELSDYVIDLLSRKAYDLILVRYMQTLYAAGLERVPEVVVDIDDIPWMAFNACVTSLYKWPVSCICKWMESNIRTHFARVVEQGNLCFVSNQEQITFPQLVFLPNIPAVGQVDEYLPFQKKCNILLFVGLMGYSANYKSIDHFVSDIWPLIKRRVPDAVLRIAGRDLPAKYEHKWKDCPGVQVLGFVDKISDEYLHAKVFISPLTIGGGTNIKILEAMKYGLPIVATSFSVRGYSTFIQNGGNILIADDDAPFAEKCTELLENGELNERISIKSRLSVDHIYSYENFKKIIMTHIFQKDGEQEMGRVL